MTAFERQYVGIERTGAYGRRASLRHANLARPVTAPFTSHFIGVAGARVHYIDEGDGPVFLGLHGL